MEHNILDNRQRGTVAEFLQKNITENAEVCIVSAYFTIYAYEKLKDKFNGIKSLRFLFGEPSFLKNLDPDKHESKAFKIEKDDTIALANALAQKATARECYEWIQSKVEVRSMVKPDFLHGKLYHIAPENNGEAHALVGSSNFTVNGLGLGKKPNLELNLVINDRRDLKEVKDWFEDIWAGKIEGAHVEDVKGKVLEYLEQIYTDKSPQFIYFKTLYHIFQERLRSSQEVEDISEKIGLTQTVFWKETLFEFQRQGAKGAIDKLLRYNGCILADSVGLGKTFEALAVIKYFELQNNRVLVLCPKKLEQNWIIYTQNIEQNTLKQERFSYDVFAHTDLTRTAGKASNGMNLENVNWGNYGLVVIDESHNFRNSGKTTDKRVSRYDKVMNEIIKQGVKTKVLLLSATPVNTTLRDLRNQLYFITEGEDNAFEKSLGIKHIGNLLQDAQRRFAMWADRKRNPNPVSGDLFNVLGTEFFTLLSELTIARSRKQIKENYQGTDNLNFPARLPNRNEYPDIDTEKRFPSFATINQRISEYSLAIFNPAQYVKDEFRHLYNLPTDAEKEAEKKRKEEEKKNKQAKKKGNASPEANFNQDDRERSLIGMMKVGFLKRLESSIASFTKTLKTTADKVAELEKKIEAFQQNKNAQDATIEAPEATDMMQDDEEFEALETDMVGKKLLYNLKHLDLNKWLTDLKQDREKIEFIEGSASKILPTRDKKLQDLRKIMQDKIENPLNASPTGKNKKILVFTAYADTALYLYENIAAWAKTTLGLDSALVTGGTHANRTTFEAKEVKDITKFENLLINFAPIAKKRNLMPKMPQDHEIDILIATDCISEGQNLQDCDFLINYDIHWNPVRLIQRFGRIDRLGSQNKQIQMLNFWATPDLDLYLNLEMRVKARMALVDITATADDNILQDEVGEQETAELNYRAEQLKKLKDNPLDLEEIDDKINFSEFSFEEFLEELKAFLYQNSMMKQIEASANGLYAVVPAPVGEFKELAPAPDLFTNMDIGKGVIFCFLQKEKSEKMDNINPLGRCFLVWLTAEGKVKHSYTEPKKILSIYRQLCQSHDTAIEELCKVFDQETDNGKDMNVYNELVKKAIDNIRSLIEKRELQSLFGGRDASISENKPKSENDFELLTWLVVK